MKYYPQIKKTSLLIAAYNQKDNIQIRDEALSLYFHDKISKVYPQNYYIIQKLKCQTVNYQINLFRRFVLFPNDSMKVKQNKYQGAFNHPNIKENAELEHFH